MKPAHFVIGMDGGGTKTLALIADMKGEVLAQHVAGPTNIQIAGVEHVARTLYSLMMECCESVGATPAALRGLTVGLAGAGRAGDKTLMERELRRLLAAKRLRVGKIRVESDARVALEGAFKGEAGVILIAGTGSVAFGKDQSGRIHRTGGWGRLLGDEGSGYFIGREALVALCRSIDGRSGPTELSRLLAKRFRIRKPEEIVAAAYRDGLELASLAPLVFEAAEEGDDAAREIVQMSAQALLEHVRTLVVKVAAAAPQAVRRKILLSLVGSLIAKNTPLRRLLLREIRLTLSDVAVVAPMASPAYGAVMMAIH